MTNDFIWFISYLISSVSMGMTLGYLHNTWEEYNGSI